MVSEGERLVASIKKRPNGKWRARYRDAGGKEHARHFKYKDNPRDPDNSAQHWLDSVTAAIVTNTYLDPERAKLTVNEWCDTWIVGYSTRRKSTVTQAKSHIKHIRKKFGDRRLASIRPSEVKQWMGELRSAGFEMSTIRALHSRLGQILGDAAHDGLIPRSPVSRRTSPGTASQRPYVATTAQIWAIYDALPEHLRGIVLLGAFAGLRRNEMVALRVSDVDFLRGIITPAIQYPSDPLKTEISKTPIPIPQSLALELNRMPAKWGSSTIIVGERGQPISPRLANEEWVEARAKVGDLPEGFRIHDLRHYFASMLIASGLDVKVVQARLRHGSAKTTLDTYGHLWPDSDETSRAAVDAILSERFSARADSLRTVTPASQ